MKILKKAKQKNFIVDNYYHTDEELISMHRNNIIQTNEEIFVGVDLSLDERNTYRIFASDCKEIKVICHEGYYVPVVITNNGLTVHITL